MHKCKAKEERSRGEKLGKGKKKKRMACDIYFSIHVAPLTGERISSCRCLLSYCKTLSVLLNEVNNLIQEHLTEIIPL